MICVRSWYSFLRGTSSPSALVDRAKELGVRALALVDDEGLYGAVEFWKRCRAVGIHPVLGARVGGVLFLVRNRTGYGNLCRIITAPDHPDREGLLVSPPGTREAIFSVPREFRLHQLLSAIRQNTLLAHVGKVGSPESVLRPDEDPTATDRIAETCDWEFLPAPKIFPKFGGGMEELRQVSFQGLAWRYPERPPFERLCRELDLIGKLGYADYFLVVRDIVRHSRDRGVPVAGRGSGASSVVAYVLGITNVCPVEFDLPFERFLHEGRTDYPDLDIDFCWRIRDDILDYVFHRFGDVAMVSTHITFQQRSAFREAAKAFGCSDSQVTQMRRRRVRVPRIEAAAKALLGIPRHLSVHCGGVVLRPDGVAPMQPSEKGVIVTQYDKRSVEEVGLVKIDLLGNRALSTIRETVEIVERTTGTRPDVERLPIDDRTVRLLQEGKTIGCNQLESPGMRALLRMMRPSNPKGLMKALALIRPGASSLGMKERFIRRVRGLEPSPHGPMLAETHGVMLYEDDAMMVASDLAGLSLSEGDLFRRKVQKLRTEEERVSLSREFLALCGANGTSPVLAADFWVQMVKFNEFSFCRAHAASYGVLAWASAWLAAHHPVAHWVAALNNNQGLYDARVYVEQAKREGIDVRLPCIQRSGIEFTEEAGAIRVGLGRIFSLAEKEIAQIREGRPFDSLGDFLLRTRISRPSLRNLALCGAFDWTGLPRPGIWMKARAKGGAVPPVPDHTEAEKFRYEMEILGLSARRHPLFYLYGERSSDSRLLPKRVGKRVRLVGLMATARVAMTARREAMQFLTLEDEHGLFEVTCFPKVFQRYRSLVGTLGPYVVEGRVEERYDAITLNAERLSLPTDPFQAFGGSRR